MLNLKALVVELTKQLNHQNDIIEQLRHQLGKLQKLLFGQSSEKLGKERISQSAKQRKVGGAKSPSLEKTIRNGRRKLSEDVGQCAERLAPIVQVMKATCLLPSPKIHSDDTIMPVLAARKIHRGRLWVYRGGTSTIPACVIYQYSPIRKQEVPLNFLANYQGFL